MSEAERHIARETAVSAGINGVLSLGFFSLMFGSPDTIAVWGASNYAFDFLPQSFAIGFMSAVVPSMMLRQALAKGRLAPLANAVPASRSIVLRAFLTAVAALVLGSALAIGALWGTGVETVDGLAALAFKVLYGAALGGFITFASLRGMIQ
jgi:hypothetical protein